MKKEALYKYTRPDGGVTISPIKPNSEYTVIYRLTAEDGFVLANGDKKRMTVHTEKPDEWHEEKGG